MKPELTAVRKITGPAGKEIFPDYTSHYTFFVLNFAKLKMKNRIVMGNRAKRDSRNICGMTS